MYTVDLKEVRSKRIEVKSLRGSHTLQVTYISVHIFFLWFFNSSLVSTYSTWKTLHIPLSGPMSIKEPSGIYNDVLKREPVEKSLLNRL